MADHVELDLVHIDQVVIDTSDATPVELDLVDGEAVTIEYVDGEVVLEVVGEVGPRGIQGIEGIQGIQGIQGEIGPIGPEGPAGLTSGYYRHNQASASATWLVTHDLAYPPAVTVVDSAGTQIYGDVTYLSDSLIQIEFSAPNAGYAYCT